MCFSFRFDDDRWDGGNRTPWDYVLGQAKGAKAKMIVEGDGGDEGNSGDVRGSTGGEGGVSCFSKFDAEEKRGGDGEVGVEPPQSFHPSAHRRHQTRSAPVGMSQLQLVLAAAVGAVCSEQRPE